MNVTPSGWVFLVLTCVWLPLVAIRSASRLEQVGRAPSPKQRVASVLVLHGLALVAALASATYDWIELFPSPDFGALDILLFAVSLGAFLGTLPLRWRWKTPEEKQRMFWILPRTNADLSWWALVSLVAGIVEEIVYRGVMLALWQRILGSWALAVLVCVAVFTVSHWIQGWRAMAAIAALSVGMHFVVRWTGDLYTAMAVHAVYDFFAGVIMLRLARREGLS